MPIQFIDPEGTFLDVDTSNKLYIEDVNTPPGWRDAGGYFTVAGQTSAVVAASLASGTTLMAMRMSSSSTREAFITRFRTFVSSATVGTNGLVPGVISIQRFSGATPSGGTARTPNSQGGYSLGSSTDITDIRDNNAALTVTSVVFGSVVAAFHVPITITVGVSGWDCVYEPSIPILLKPGEGLCIRTQIVMPATQTWMYNYTVHWFEK